MKISFNHACQIVQLLPKPLADSILQNIRKDKLIILSGEETSVKALKTILERYKIPHCLKNETTEVIFDK